MTAVLEGSEKKPGGPDFLSHEYWRDAPHEYAFRSTSVDGFDCMRMKHGHLAFHVTVRGHELLIPCADPGRFVRSLRRSANLRTETRFYAVLSGSRGECRIVPTEDEVGAPFLEVSPVASPKLRFARFSPEEVDELIDFYENHRGDRPELPSSS